MLMHLLRFKLFCLGAKCNTSPCPRRWTSVLDWKIPTNVAHPVYTTSIIIYPHVPYHTPQVSPGIEKNLSSSNHPSSAQTLMKYVKKPVFLHMIHMISPIYIRIFLVIYSYFIVIVINITYDIPIYSYLNHGIFITASQGLVTSLGRATKRWLGTCLATEVVRWLWRIPWEKKTPFFRWDTLKNNPEKFLDLVWIYCSLIWFCNVLYENPDLGDLMLGITVGGIPGEWQAQYECDQHGRTRQQHF